MWPDPPNEFTYNLLCGTKHRTPGTSMGLGLQWSLETHPPLVNCWCPQPKLLVVSCFTHVATTGTSYVSTMRPTGGSAKPCGACAQKLRRGPSMVISTSPLLTRTPFVAPSRTGNAEYRFIEGMRWRKTKPTLRPNPRGRQLRRRRQRCWWRS
jgi:hypothetical protein